MYIKKILLLPIISLLIITGCVKEPTNQAYFSDNVCKMLEITQQDIRITIYYNVLLGNGKIQQKSYNFDKVVVDPKLGKYDMSFSKIVTASLLKSTERKEENTIIRYGDETIRGNMDFKISGGHLEVTDSAVGINAELFEQIYSEFKDKKQFAIFITDYAYLDEVKLSLSKLGYEGFSCFKASVAGYDVNKVIVRYVNLVVSILALLLINIVSVLLGYTILKVKKNDYVIFKMIGMPNNMCKKVNYIELISYALISMILLIIVSTIVKYNVTNLFIVNAYKYIKVYDYLIVLAVSLCSMFLLGRRYAEFITNKAKVTVLKEVE